MSKSASTPAAIQKSLVQQVQSIAAHTRGVSDEVAKMSKGLKDGMQSSTDPTAELLSAINQLSAITLNASNSLADCFNDLVAMGEAMTPVLENSPEAAPALLLNFFSTFVTQMNSFYTEMNAGWSKGTQGFVRGKAAFYREPAPATPRAAAAVLSPAAAASPPQIPASSSAVSPPPPPSLGTNNADEGEENTDVAVPAARTERHKKHAVLEDELGQQEGGREGGAAAVKKKPGKKKKAAATTTVPPTEEADNNGPPLRDSTGGVDPAGQSANDPNSVSSRSSAEDTMEALAAAAESGAQTAATRRGQKSAPRAAANASDDTAPQLTPAELEALAQSEPPYLTVTSTLEAALGPVVLGSRPNVFSQIASFTYDEPVSTYYIRLVRPGSLAHFIFKNYLHEDEETQADFLCDVLETDCAEVDPFTSPSGEVSVASAANLAAMPPCAWGIGSSEDNERRLYTMYALIRQPPRFGPTAVIHDSLNMNGVRDEVVHMVSLVEALPQYAKVTCMVHSDVRSAEVPNQKQAAILSFSRSGFAQQGFTEVSEAEMQAALSRVKPARTSTVDLYQGRDRNAATTFQPPVQLASLSQPAEDAGISLGDVARGAMQGGMEVLKAPFTVGRAVGGALLDVTGVSGAVRNNIEGTFRKSFPELADETVVESYNCAWMRKGVLTQGLAFITTHWLCFQSTVSAAKFSVEYDEIKDIVKSKSAKMFENALEIKTHLNDSIFLTSFLQRDQAYNALMKEWLKQ
ncbi:GRAM domain containing protein [Lotmaria passim]